MTGSGPSNDDIASAYNQVPYGFKAHAPAHPIRISTVARLRGLASAPLDCCRVLELGCAEGGHLLALAERAPRSTFVGVELSNVQVERAHEWIRASGFENVEVHCLDLVDVDERFGEFDYVIAHGVYSWVPAPVRDALLAVCCDRLSPRGLAYVSYNVAPGWLFGELLRTMIQEAAPAGDLPARIEAAREVARRIQADEHRAPPFGALLAARARSVLGNDDAYVAHEYLEPVNEAVTVTEFLDHASRHGLHFVDDLVAPGTVPPDDVPGMQYLDRVTGRTFRAAVLSRHGSGVAVDPEAIRDCFVSSRLKPEGGVVFDGTPVTFRDGAAEMSSTSPVLAAALAVLADRWPACTPVREVEALAAARLEDGRASIPGEDDPLFDGLLELHRSRLLEITDQPFGARSTVSDRPAVAAIVRLAAGRDGPIQDIRHDGYNVDEFQRHVLALLDGTRTPAEVVDALQHEARAGILVLIDEAGAPLQDVARDSAIAEGVRPFLARLASLGMLSG